MFGHHGGGYRPRMRGNFGGGPRGGGGWRGGYGGPAWEDPAWEDLAWEEVTERALIGRGLRTSQLPATQGGPWHCRTGEAGTVRPVWCVRRTSLYHCVCCVQCQSPAGCIQYPVQCRLGRKCLLNAHSGLAYCAG